MKRLFGEELDNLLRMNFVTALLCLPVVTAGPAMLALVGTLIKIMDGRCNLSRMTEYKGLFCKKFRKGVLLELLIAVYGVLLLWCVGICDALGNSGEILRIIVIAAMMFAALVSTCVAIVLACVELPFGKAFWNGICLAYGCFPRATLSTLCSWGIGVVGVLFYPLSIVPLAVILLSAGMACSVAAIWPAVKEFLLNQDELPPS